MRFGLVVVLGTCLLLPGCNRSTKGSASGDPAKTIGVVPKGASHIFWQTVHAGAVKAAREYGYVVEWNAPTLEIDSSRQIQIVESMVNRHLAGLALAPVDRKALTSIVDRAASSGMPVAIFDSNIDTENYVQFVATDNRESGRMAARRMGEICGGVGKVGVVGFMPGSASTTEREAGFAEELKAKFPRMELIGIQFSNADRSRALAAAENMMVAHPDLAGLFADNESSSMGAVQAVKARGNKTIKLVAYDASEQLIADLRAGAIDSIVVQNPFKMGYEAVKAIGMKLKGETPQRKIDSGAVLIRREDLDKPETKELLFPDIQQYLQ